MAENMIKRMQEVMNVNIEKIDLNEENLSTPERPEAVDFVAQATIPTALIGTLVKLTHIKTDDLEQMNGLSFEKVFGKKSETVAHSVAQYAATTPSHAIEFLNMTFDALNDILLQRYSGDMAQMRKDLESGQNAILAYLPAKINLGATLNLNSIEDRTHKMEGILSSIANYLFNEDIRTDDEKK